MNIRMPSLNMVVISGNLTDDPRQNILENGVHVTNFRVASNQFYKGRDNEFHKKTCYVDVVCWRKTAEIAADLTLSAAVERGLEELADGDGPDWTELKKDLGL